MSFHSILSLDVTLNNTGAAKRAVILNIWSNLGGYCRKV